MVTHYHGDILEGDPRSHRVHTHSWLTLTHLTAAFSAQRPLFCPALVFFYNPLRALPAGLLKQDKSQGVKREASHSFTEKVEGGVC